MPTFRASRRALASVEIPEIKPDVTRVTLLGGVCPCCAKRFKAKPSAGLEPGSPFGPNLRAFVIYLRSVQGIPMARLSEVLKDMFGLDISEGALVNILSDSREPFARGAKRCGCDAHQQEPGHSYHAAAAAGSGSHNSR